MANWKMISALLGILAILGAALYWLSAKYYSSEISSSDQARKEYLLRNSHRFSLFGARERSELKNSLVVDLYSPEGKEVQLSDLRFRGVLERDPRTFQLPERPEWWGRRKLKPQAEAMELNVRPNDEFLEELWLNDMNVQKSLKNLDIQRPPVKAEIVIPY